ncbi:MAG: hypothetical protein ACKPKO_52020, partial [Candidatus Fonsibacter sp.]
MVASDPEHNTTFTKHYERLTRNVDKLKFALQLKLDRSGSVMAATETHSSSCVENGYEEGSMEDS